jgi:hypothetical protein
MLSGRASPSLRRLRAGGWLGLTIAVGPPTPKIPGGIIMKKVLTIGKVFKDDLGVRTKKTIEVVSDGFAWAHYESLAPEDPDLNVWDEDV